MIYDALNDALTSGVRLPVDFDLSAVSCEDATELHNFIVKIVTLAKDSTDLDFESQLSTITRPLQWKNAIGNRASVLCLANLLEIGVFMEHLHDASCLSPTSRYAHWHRADSENASMRETHTRAVEELQLQSRRRQCLTEIKLFSYNLVQKKRLVDGQSEWKQIILLPTTDLATKPPLFWRHIRAEHLHAVYLASILHRVDLLHDTMGVDATPKSFRDQCKDMEVRVLAKFMPP